jgi:hypothetical protein
MPSNVKISGSLIPCLSAFLSMAAAAYAGDLRTSPDIAQCDYYFSGSIEAGDADRIEAAIAATASGTRLCLNSPGGDFVEGLRMFHVIWNKDSVATYVRNGDNCLSACAIAFLGGSLVVGTGAIRSKNAVIEPGAWLGFHAPRLVLPDGGAHSSANVRDAYALALIDTSRLFALTQNVEHGARGMSEFLFARTIATPPDLIYAIDTIGKASLAQVSLAQVPFPEITWGGLRNVCDTAVIMTDGQFSGIDNVDEAFKTFADTGQDGSGKPIALDDRVWSWSSGYFVNFVIRGYPAPHVNETFCKISLSQVALDRETNLPLEDRDPTTQWFSVTLWTDAQVPVDRSFSSYAENSAKADELVSVPWAALWDPMTPLSRFVP